MFRREIIIAKETKKPRFLDFYELDTFRDILYYVKETIRVKGKWYFVEEKQQDFIENPISGLFVKPLGKKMFEVRG